MKLELQRRWQLERWISWVRVAAVPWAILEVGLLTPDYPSTRYEVAAWVATGVFALGSGIFFWVDRRDIAPGLQRYCLLRKPGVQHGGHLDLLAHLHAQAHGGTLEVHSVPTEGATFALVLPVEPAG